jgi:hypothetical protein
MKTKIYILSIIIFSLLRINCISQNDSNKIIAPDKLYLRSGWTWLSFPRLERTPNNPTPQTVLAQDRISGTDYTSLEMQQNKIVNGEPVMTYVTWNYSGWQNNDLTEVDSKFGYKLYLEPTENRTIDMLGTVLDPSTTVDIYQGSNDPENWEGYWLYESQWPFDAIPDNVLDELTVIKEQDWCCVKEWHYIEGNLVPYWICAVHKGDVSFDYGDMVILKTNSDLSFQWQRYGNTPSSEEKSATEYFQFNEQSNYTSFFIELDTNSNPQEIGAFIGDSCVGASTVLTNDTNVLIPGYIEGMSGDVTFEEYYDSLKSGKPKIKEYFVNNIKTRTWEKRIINTGEKQDYYLISFKTGKITNETESNSVSINCAPNPLKNEVTIKFTVHKECMLQIVVYDLYGKSLNILQQGDSKAGTYNINWAGTDGNGKPLPNGVYILKLRAGTEYAQTKVVIVK